jgi:hypothetical protein
VRPSLCDEVTDSTPIQVHVPGGCVTDNTVIRRSHSRQGRLASDPKMGYWLCSGVDASLQTAAVTSAFARLV